MISIIIPVYKAEKYLIHCLDSVSAQTYQDLDIILIDDGSPDECGKICDSYVAVDSRFRVFHTKNQGHYQARNLALAKAREVGSKYIGFVDADDWIEPDMYETLLDIAEKCNADIVSCSSVKEWTTYSKKRLLHNKNYDNIGALFALFTCELDDHLWDKLWRIECFDNIQFPNGRFYEDATTTYKIIAQIKTLITTSKVEYHYRQVGKSIIHTYDISLIILWKANLEKYQYASLFFIDKISDMEYKRLINIQTKNCAVAIAKNWRWWEKHTSEEKNKYKENLDEMFHFSCEHLPLFGKKGWSVSLRFFTFLSHFDCALSRKIGCLVNLFSHKREYY